MYSSIRPLNIEFFGSLGHLWKKLMTTCSPSAAAPSAFVSAAGFSWAAAVSLAAAVVYFAASVEPLHAVTDNAITAANASAVNLRIFITCSSCDFIILISINIPSSTYNGEHLTHVLSHMQRNQPESEVQHLLPAEQSTLLLPHQFRSCQRSHSLPA